METQEIVHEQSMEEGSDLEIFKNEKNLIEGIYKRSKKTTYLSLHNINYNRDYNGRIINGLLTIVILKNSRQFRYHATKLSEDLKEMINSDVKEVKEIARMLIKDKILDILNNKDKYWPYEHGAR